MKTFKLLFSGLFFLLCTLSVKAQTSGVDYFAGEWSVLVKGLPNGDTKMTIVLEKKENSLTGAVLDTAGNEISKLDKVAINPTSVTVFFSAQGYDVNLVMNKKDENHVTGNMMGMFDAEGERVKAKK